MKGSKGLLKAVIAALVFTGVATAASAQVTISAGFALSYMEASSDAGAYNVEGDIGAGGNIYVDYLLPIRIPLFLGLEVGVDSSSFKDGGYKDTVLAVPLLLRAAYHFDLLPKLDFYAVGKIGAAFGVWTGDTYDMIKDIGGSIDNPVGFAFGVDLGAAYYFTPRFGIFAEVGFDDYILSSKVSVPGDSFTIDVPFYRFFTIGISTKF